MNRVHDRKAPGGNHGFTAAAAAVADKIHLLPDIFAELTQIVLIGLVQELQAFPFVDPAGVTVLD